MIVGICGSGKRVELQYKPDRSLELPLLVPNNSETNPPLRPSNDSSEPSPFEARLDLPCENRVTKSTLCRPLDEESPLGLLDKRFLYPISHRVANREWQTEMVVVGELPNLNLRA